MPDEKIILRWVKALRSGEYKQGRALLKYKQDDEFYYCCLGVLCEIAHIESREFSTKKRDNVVIYEYVVPNEQQILTGFLPIFLRDSVGITQTEEEQLSRLNDGELDMNTNPYSFDQIADYIEEKYL